LLTVLVVDVRKVEVVVVTFLGAAAESERRAARAGMTRNFMAKGECEMKMYERRRIQRIKFDGGCSRLKLEVMR